MIVFHPTDNTPMFHLVAKDEKKIHIFQKNFQRKFTKSMDWFCSRAITNSSREKEK